MIPNPYVYVKNEHGVQLNVAQFPLAPWARWIAANQDGLVYQYEHEPAASMPYWWIAPGRQSYVGIIDLTGVDWRQTLTLVSACGDTPTRPETVLGWQLAQLDAAQLEAVAQHLARTARPKADYLADALWTALEAERQRLRLHPAMATPLPTGE